MALLVTCIGLSEGVEKCPTMLDEDNSEDLMYLLLSPICAVFCQVRVYQYV